MTRRDLAVAALLLLAVTAVTLAASARQGITRDEAYYIEAGQYNVQWIEDALTGKLDAPFSASAIRRYWHGSREHPPLWKVLYGISWRLLHRCECAADAAWHPEIARLARGRHATLGLLPELAAARLPTALAFGVLCALVYVFFVAALGTRLGGLTAALLTFAQPRAFFHAQTASFDVPAAMLWFATTALYWHALAAPTRRPALATGALYGGFLATKLQSFFLPFALGAHWLWLAWRRRRSGAPLPTPAPLLAMALLGPLVVLLVWPYLLRFPAHVVPYLRFHWNHTHYNFEYLGRNWNEPPYPWHEPLGMLLFTAPVVLLALAVGGALALAAARVRRGGDERETTVLLGVAAVLPVAPFLLGSTPIYGATKHWLALMPFLALCAGVAVDRLHGGLVRELRLHGRPVARGVVAALLLAVSVAPAAVETWRSHPHGLSHYNALAGGAPGGADLGLNRQFWGYAVKDVLPWLNERLPRGARVYFHDANHEAILLYRRAGALRSDLVETRRAVEPRALRDTDAALVVHERHFGGIDYAIWEAYGHVQPAGLLTLDGVPLVSVYLREPPGPP